MKKHLLLFFLIIIGSSLFAQEVISTQGDTYSNSNGVIDFTVGEVVINTGTDGTNDLTQGFHQSNWNFVGLDNFVPEFKVSVFPNPSEDVLNISASSFENVTYTLYDAQGRNIMQNKLSANLTSIDVSDIAQGNYSLTLTNNNQKKMKTFKLVKLY